MNLAMLTALNRAPEIKLHVKGALNNGVTVEEIKAALLDATAYCGIPAGSMHSAPHMKYWSARAR
jgi:4-carboxymuconolactone decarboxylase